MDVKVHKKGIIVIPAEVRKEFNIKEGAVIDLEIEEDKIVLRPKQTLLDAYGIDGKEAGKKLLEELEKMRKEEVEKENSS
ncbi:AbrB/MazE/SpoVT family DNA-binding domain-containing protein [Acidianus brierleyi]|uniref:AbrB family transcriptional regulator n=1 Tax=Acidianus brierleyi TaxID=41673 RepID=A0A2U9ICC2_9CREN|nr:AbrB/MazE/SpoVT family DNA-binding domain-containing protein [Acidianus brierleyi]AWR93675.1 AbrB/MazE/SpoVT family DNA-binding domain-containing protein [Acidianus brierleyi]